MDSFNYFNQLEAYNQARQLYETYRQDKDEILSAKDDTAGGLSLATSSELLQKSLTSDSFKNGLKNLLKTGNDDIDNAVKNTIDNISSESNPVQVISDLTSNIRPVLQARASQFVRNGISKLLGREPLEVKGSGAQTSEINSTVQNPAFEDMDTPYSTDLSIPEPDRPMATNEIDQIYEDVLNRVPQGIPEDLIPEGAGSRLTSLTSNVSDRIGNLSNDLSNRASGVLEDVQNRTNALSNDLVENLQSAQNRLQGVASQVSDTVQNTVQDGLSNTLGNIQSRLQNLQSQLSDQVDVNLARLNPSGSTSNQIGDLLRGNINIPSTSEAQTSSLSDGVDNLISSGRNLLNNVVPDIADTIPDSIESVASNVASNVGDAVSTGLSTASEALAGGATAEEAVGAVLDSTGILAPLGALLGLFGLGGSLASILDHHASRPNFGGAMPAFEPGL